MNSSEYKNMLAKLLNVSDGFLKKQIPISDLRKVVKEIKEFLGEDTK